MSEITKIARNLRKKQTAAEKKLWHYLRNYKQGVKFRRQHSVTYTLNGENMFFVADFACVEKRIIIEVDGEIHEKQKEKDQERDSILEKCGYIILRFKNIEIEENIDNVINIIKIYIVRSSPSALRAPSP